MYRAQGGMQGSSVYVQATLHLELDGPGHTNIISAEPDYGLFINMIYTYLLFASYANILNIKHSSSTDGFNHDRCEPHHAKTCLNAMLSQQTTKPGGRFSDIFLLGWAIPSWCDYLTIDMTMTKSFWTCFNMRRFNWVNTQENVSLESMFVKSFPSHQA